LQCTGSSYCKKTCASDELDCYLLDNNGFVLLSERSEHTGKFFGQIDGTIMDSLVQDRIFRRVALMDFQGACSDRDNPYNAAGERLNPIQPVSWIFKYFFTFATTWLSFFTTPIISWPTVYSSYDEEDMPTYDEYDPNPDYGSQDFEDTHITHPEIEKHTPQQTPRIVTPSSATTSGPRVIPDPAHARPCDLRTDLYLLQPDRLNSSGQSNPLKVILKYFYFYFSF
jgi:Neuronal voltage-dependent calcium channel alpha 2acd